MTAPRDDATIENRVGLEATRIGFGDRPVLISVDLQRLLTRDEGIIGADLSTVIEHTNELIALADDRDVPVVFVRNVPYPNGERIGKWAKLTVPTEASDPSNPSGQLDERLNVRDHHVVVDKRQANAFFETPLHSMLTAWGIDTVILTGCSTSGCIRATALGSCARGFRTILPESCLGDRSPDQHEANLQDINTRIGDVVSMNEVREYLRADGS